MLNNKAEYSIIDELNFEAKLKTFMLEVNNATAEDLFTITDKIKVFLFENELTAWAYLFDISLVEAILQTKEGKTFLKHYCNDRNTFLDKLYENLQQGSLQDSLSYDEILKLCLYIEKQERKEILTPLCFEFVWESRNPLEKFDNVHNYMAHFTSLININRNTKEQRVKNAKEYANQAELITLINASINTYFMSLPCFYNDFCTIPFVVKGKKNIIIAALHSIMNRVKLFIKIEQNNKNIEFSRAEKELIKAIQDKQLYNNADIKTQEQLAQVLYPSKYDTKNEKAKQTSINKKALKMGILPYDMSKNTPIEKLFYIAKNYKN